MKRTGKWLLGVVLICAMLISGLATGCTTQKTEKADSNETVSFTDSAGRTVEIPKNIERIAPSGALAQQILLTVAPDKLVGLSGKITDSQAKYLGDEYAALPVFGQFYGSGDLNMEALAAAKPQVVIDIGEPKKTVVEDMDGIQEQIGIPTIFIEAKMDTMDQAYKTLGEILGVEDQGNKLSEYCAGVYKDVTEKMATIPEDQRVSFAYLQGDAGLDAIAKGSYHAEVMDMIGNNVVAIDNPTSKGTGDTISQEQLAQWNPSVIIFGPNSIYATASSDPFFATMSAIQTNKYYEVPNNPYNWMGMPPSVNRYLGMQWMANMLYPDVFKYDMYKVTKEYYDLFYHYDLSQADYQELTKNAIK
ncbi:ABC transporter substrate-binding protein [Acetobacterium woodii]|nr:ABC transporter substrate-binding protein [Acetobacterium woodii]